MTLISRTLMSLSLLCGLAMVSAPAAAQSACTFDKPVYDVWQDAFDADKANPDSSFAAQSHKDAVAVAILVWQARGVVHEGNPSGLDVSYRKDFWSDALFCYALDDACGMTRNSDVPDAFRAIRKGRAWTPADFPERAPAHMVAWAEGQLNCAGRSGPVRFTAPAPVSVPSKPSSPVAQAPETPPSNPALIPVPVAKPSPQPTQLRCDQGNTGLCRAQYESGKSKCEDPSQPESVRDILCGGFTYPAALGCVSGDNGLCLIAAASAETGYGWAAPDPAGAARYAEIACNRNDPSGCDKLTALTGQYPDAAPQTPEAYARMDTDMLSMVCLKDNVEACKIYYERIKDTDPDAYGVAEWICVETRNPSYCYVAGNTLYNGYNTPVNLTRAYDAYWLGCSYGGPKSCNAAATMVMNGVGVGPDKFAAQPMFAKACRSRVQDSCAWSDQLTRQMAQGASPRQPAAPRRDDPEEMVCRRTPMVGNGGRMWNSYECKKRREW